MSKDTKIRIFSVISFMARCKHKIEDVKVKDCVISGVPSISEAFYARQRKMLSFITSRINRRAFS